MRFKRSTFANVGCIILLFMAAQSTLAVDLAGRLRLGGFAGVATSEQEDVNGIMDDLEEFWSAWEIELGNVELRSALSGGVYAEYLIEEDWVVGVEFLRVSSSSGYDWYLESDGTTDVDVGCAATGSLASVYGLYRLPLGDSSVALRLGAGAGYLFGSTFDLDVSVDKDGQVGPAPGDTTLLWQAELQASGSAVAFHGLVGAEYELTDRLLLSADFAYRVASLGELEVDSISASVDEIPDGTWDIEEGDILRWYNGEGGTHFSATEGDEVGLDFSGFHITLSVAYVF